MAKDGFLSSVARLRRGDEVAGRPRRHRWRWRLVVLVGVVLVIAYYGVAVRNLRSHDASAVVLDESEERDARSQVTLQVEAIALDPGAGSFDFEFRPVPDGRLEGSAAGELEVPLQVTVSSSSRLPPVTFDFAEDQLIDPASVSVSATTEASGFPFDRPRSSFGFEVLSDGQPVAAAVEMVDETEGWNLSGDVRTDDDGLWVDMRANRESLAVSLALFYIAAVVVVALITMAVVGGALVKGRIEFSQVIWLGAMLVVIPTVRNEMPGVPPVGTAVDLFVFFPAIVIVGVALLAGMVVFVANEAGAIRDEAPAEPE